MELTSEGVRESLYGNIKSTKLKLVGDDNIYTCSFIIHDSAKSRFRIFLSLTRKEFFLVRRTFFHE